MKVIFVGLGSIGKRHLKNLHQICQIRSIELEVTALRATSQPLPDDIAPLVHQQGYALPDENFDLAFITNPTHLHAMAIGSLIGRVNAFFIEKPLFDHPQYNLAALGLSPTQKAYVAAPMRWTGLYAALQKHLPSWQVYAARSICSSYLPEWRSGVDYRENYSAHREMGGGVCLDLIHEWDYLFGLFGPPLKSHSLCGHFSHLEIDSDDLAVYIARWEGLLGELHLDYFGRTYRRQLELFCADGTILADFGAGSLTLPDGSMETYAEDANARYLREMEYFLTYALAGRGESANSPRLALDVLKTALGEEERK